eukprot:26731_1
MDIKLKLNDDIFEILDELLLMSSTEELFPIVSLLRLLLVYPSVCNRYNKDFMIINQILYKIGIPFEEENDDNDEEKDDDDNIGINLLDIHLLQFTTIAAVSHLYNGEGDMISIGNNFINLSLNALKIKNCNVRLSASRLLFNMVYELKRQYIFMTNDTSDVTKDYSSEIEVLIKQLIVIVNGVIKQYLIEKHVP